MSREEAYQILLEEAHLNGNPIIKAIFDSAWRMSEQNILATVTPYDRKERETIGTFTSLEEYYEELAYHCYVYNLRVGDAFEGMRDHFKQLWQGRKEYLVNHIYEQLHPENSQS